MSVSHLVWDASFLLYHGTMSLNILRNSVILFTASVDISMSRGTVQRDVIPHTVYSQLLPPYTTHITHTHTHLTLCHGKLVTNRAVCAATYRHQESRMAGQSPGQIRALAATTWKVSLYQVDMASQPRRPVSPVWAVSGATMPVVPHKTHHSSDTSYWRASETLMHGWG